MGFRSFSLMSCLRLFIRFVGGVTIIEALTNEEYRIVRNSATRMYDMTTNRLEMTLLLY